MGFYDYQARLYDPAVGRFAQADTVVPEPGRPQSLNRYTYALNSPVKYIDPSGHWYYDPDMDALVHTHEVYNEHPQYLLREPLRISPDVKQIALYLVEQGYEKQVVNQSVANTSGIIAATLETLAMGTSGLGMGAELGMAILGAGAGTLADGNPLVPILDWFGIPMGGTAGLLAGNTFYRKSGMDRIDTILSSSSTGSTLASDYFAGNSYGFQLGDNRVIVVGAASLFSTTETGIGMVSPSATLDCAMDFLGFIYGWGSSSIAQATGETMSLYHLTGSHAIKVGNTIVVLGESKQ